MGSHEVIHSDPWRGKGGSCLFISVPRFWYTRKRYYKRISGSLGIWIGMECEFFPLMATNESKASCGTNRSPAGCDIYPLLLSWVYGDTLFCSNGDGWITFVFQKRAVLPPSQISQLFSLFVFLFISCMFWSGWRHHIWFPHPQGGPIYLALVLGTTVGSKYCKKTSTFMSLTQQWVQKIEWLVHWRYRYQTFQVQIVAVVGFWRNPLSGEEFHLASRGLGRCPWDFLNKPEDGTIYPGDVDKPINHEDDSLMLCFLKHLK